MNRPRDLFSPAKPNRWPLLVASAFFLAGTSQGQSLTPPEDSLWLAASNRTLDQMRGGFDLGAGLVVSFGISRSVFINGQLATSTSFQVGDMSKLSAAQAEVITQQMASQAQVVQNGPGNSVDAGAIGPLATYIQNTLSNQTIRNQTVIQVTSNGLSLVKNMNLQATITDSINNAVRSR
jgi:hypothetical protein